MASFHFRGQAQTCTKEGIAGVRPAAEEAAKILRGKRYIDLLGRWIHPRVFHSIDFYAIIVGVISGSRAGANLYK